MANACDPHQDINNRNQNEQINDANSSSLSSTVANEEIKRTVSIAQSAILADNKKFKRNTCTSLHPTSNTDSGCGCYTNHGFIIGYPSEKRASISSYSLRRMSRRSNSIKGKSEDGELEDTTSWWHSLCVKCRQKEVGPGWEPDFWPKLCPYPICPTYRQVARMISLIIIVLFIWTIIFCIMGKEAAPGGQLFNMALLWLVAHIVGYIFRILMLPGLLGMLITGIIFQNTGLIHIQGGYRDLSSILRKVCLVVLLTRAGLDLDPHAMKKWYLQVINLGIFPWLSEAIIMGLLTHFLLDLPWLWSCLLGVIVSAVAPAVVVPCLFRLRTKGYGVTKGIPTLIIAVAGIDDALSVAFFGLLHSIMFSQHSIIYEVFLGPISIIGGIGFGIIWGYLSKLIPEKEDPFVVPLRIIMLLCGGLMAVFGSEHSGFEGAGPVGVIAAAFVSVYCWSLQGWSIEDNPVATAFEIFWILCEPVLFSLTGTQVILNQLEPETVTYGAAFITVCFIVRIFVTVILATGSSLNLKEKIFCSLSWMSKASVQAVLAPAALESARKMGKLDELLYGQILLTICIMSMLMTVPVGAISITSLGTRLLTKTKHSIPTAGWRRATRPSLRDITIIDEEIDVKVDDEERANSRVSGNEIIVQTEGNSVSTK